MSKITKTMCVPLFEDAEEALRYLKRNVFQEKSLSQIVRYCLRYVANDIKSMQDIKKL